LEEQHGARPGDRQVADLVNHEQRCVREHLEAAVQPPRGLRLLERRDQIGEVQ
jgi:hypothetical protein